MKPNLFLGPLGAGEVIIVLVILSFIYILPMIICFKRAEKLNQNKIVWGALGLFLSYIAVLVVYVLTVEKNKECPKCKESI
jgi:hypothetical protein